MDHFEELLIRNDCDIDSVPLEWVELKIYVCGLVAVEPATSYLDLWQRVIRQNEDRFKNIIQVVIRLESKTHERASYSKVQRIKF